MSLSLPDYYVAKSPICLPNSDASIGNGLFAAKTFKEGEQITAFSRPLVGSLDTERLLDTCANCFVWTQGSATGTRLYVPPNTGVQKCAGCQRFRYCSKACQKEAWNRGHKHECKLLRPMVGRDMPKAVLACMELLTRRKHNLITDEQWNSLCALQPHIDGFKEAGNWSNMTLMATGASQFSLTQNLFNKEFVAAMYARVLTNSLTMITPTLDPLGIVLDPTLGSINHSCDPNAFIMMDGAEISIRTLRPIQRDEEIYISYIDTTNPYQRRQSELKARWFFDCRCTKCQKGATLTEDQWALDPKDVAQQIKDGADAIVQQESFAQDPANYVGTSKDEIRVAALQGKAFAAYEEAQSIGDAEQAVQLIEDTMLFCQQSGLWPIHRQPYAALRDDLIVNLLSTGNYVNAWTHCAKRYIHVLPKLHPVHFHPVRVVQTWQMAMLAAYLASLNGVKAPGVDMGLITVMLVKQVLDAASLSHGAESAFTKSVRTKAEEMIEALKGVVGKGDKEVMGRELEVQREMLRQMGDWAKM